MKFSIITPALNQLAYLKRCIASVADQAAGSGIVDSCALSVGGCALPVDHCSLPVDQELPATQQPDSLTPEHALRVHHHIQDACSTDGTVEYLKEYIARQRSTDTYQLTFASEADGGMYDALNKGFSRATGEVFAWLNCDEQYLPGTLQKAAGYFEEHADVDILTGDMLIVNNSGSLTAYRKTMVPRRMYIEASHLYTLSCATFFRRRVFERLNVFDTSFRTAADEEFMLRALRSGCKAGHVREYLSVFTFSGDNLGSGSLADQEHLALKKNAPRRTRALAPAMNMLRRAEKWMYGTYTQQFPLHYEIYTDSDLTRRTWMTARSGTYKWPDS